MLYNIFLRNERTGGHIQNKRMLQGSTTHSLFQTFSKNYVQVDERSEKEEKEQATDEDMPRISFEVDVEMLNASSFWYC